MWRLLELETPEDPFMNMAIEEAVPLAVSKGIAPNTLRFWRNGRAVVVGRFQSVRDEVNLDFCREMGIPVVRRFSGGGAVYHDLGNLNYALSLGAGSCNVPIEFSESCRFLSSGIIEGLKLLGTNAEFFPPNSISVGGLKVSGSAQARKNRAVFQHGTLLIDTDAKMIESSLATCDRPSKAVKSARKPTVSLKKISGDIGIDAVKKTIAECYEKILGMKLIKGGLTEEEVEIAKELYESKYNRKEWNYMYSIRTSVLKPRSSFFTTFETSFNTFFPWNFMLR